MTPIAPAFRMTIWSGGLSLFLLLPAAAQQRPNAAPPPDRARGGETESMEVRFYDVSFLRQRDSGLISGWLGEATGSAMDAGRRGSGEGAEVFGGMKDGMGRGMGGFGGGGMFQVPDRIHPQYGGEMSGGGMGGRGMGGGGMGGGGMGGMGAMPGVSRHAHARPLDAAMQLIELSVHRQSWDAYGGEASMTLVGDQLAVYQTPAAHEQIEAIFDQLRERFASQRSVEVDMRLISVTPEEAEGLSARRDGAWDVLASRQQSAHLSVRCRDGQRASIAAGIRRSYVVKAVPVVGNSAAQSGRSIGYSPIVITPLVGIYGQVLPQIVPQAGKDATGDQAEIDLGIILANAPGEVASAEFGSGETVDRLELQTAELETSVLANEDQWILAGVAAIGDGASSLTSGEVLPHLAVLVKWRLAEEVQP